MSDNTRAYDLFCGTGADGGSYAYLALENGGWKITRNGIEVNSGDRSTLANGITEFRRLTAKDNHNPAPVNPQAVSTASEPPRA